MHSYAEPFLSSYQMPLLFFLRIKLKNYHANSQDAKSAAPVTHIIRAGRTVKHFAPLKNFNYFQIPAARHCSSTFDSAAIFLTSWAVNLRPNGAARSAIMKVVAATVATHVA